MIHHLSFTVYMYKLAIAIVLVTSGCLLLTTNAMAASSSEQANLYLMIQQLNALENTAQRSGKIANDPGRRYFFDYMRLTHDIARIRNGLNEYLSPIRAQPRDPVELSGDYTTEARTP